MITKSFILFCILLTACSCSNQDRLLNTALDLADKNRKELEKVLDHYQNQNEPEKLSAAKFLIRNMIGKQTLDSGSIKHKQPYFDALSAYRKTHDKYLNDVQYLICDSIYQQHPLQQISSKYTPDIQTLTSRFLIQHIDKHFQMREKYDWCKQIPFDVFCQYTLPYTTNNCYWTEALDFFQEKYKTFMNATQLQSHETIGNLLSEKIDSSFLQNWALFQVKYPGLLPTSFQNLAQIQLGTCVEANIYKIAVLRANGIPAILNTIPTWGNSNSPHFWTEIITKKWGKELYDNTQRPYISKKDILVDNMFWKNTYTPLIKELAQETSLQYCRTIPKIYRVNYEIQKNNLPFLTQENIPSFFQNTGLEDITDKYMQCKDITVPLWEKPQSERPVYLCCYDTGVWHPVCWNLSRRKNVFFPKMAVNVLYLPAYYLNNRIIPAGDAFILQSDGTLKHFSYTNEDKISEAIFYSKMPYRLHTALQAATTVGSRFYVCNRKDMKDSIQVYSIQKTPFYVDSFYIPTHKKYRYFICNFNHVPSFEDPYAIAEIKIFDPQGQPIHAQVTGTPGLSDKKLELLTDGDRVTYYQPSQFEKQQYVLFDFGEPRAIGKVEFYPRSDDNRIVTGELYELFYWDREWISLGKQVAQANQLVYHNIPQNALFRIHNHTRGKEHRPFTYENGKQVWW